VSSTVQSLHPAAVLIDAESMSAAERRAVVAELAGSHGPVDVIPSRVDPVHGSITSAAIVERVRNGEVAAALELLGRPFELECEVKRLNGASTGVSRWSCASNDSTIVTPPAGIYVARVRVRGQWRGAALLIGAAEGDRHELVISERASSSGSVVSRTSLVEIGLLERWPETAGHEVDGVTAAVAAWRRRRAGRASEERR
jgi:hypothetical protein